MNTFAEIQSHLKMEEERLKYLVFPVRPLSFKGIDSEAIRAISVGNTKRHLALFKGLDLKLGLPRNKREKER